MLIKKLFEMWIYINPSGQLLPLLVVTLINNLIMELSWLGHKKRRGAKFLSIAYLYNQALALPLPKDKQPKACPRRAIYINPLRPYDPQHIYTKTHSTLGELHLINIYIRNEDVGEYNIHPRERFVASPL